MTKKSKYVYASQDSLTGSSKRIRKEKNFDVAMTYMKKEWRLSAAAELSGYSQKELKDIGIDKLFNYRWSHSQNRFLNRDG